MPWAFLFVLVLLGLTLPRSAGAGTTIPGKAPQTSWRGCGPAPAAIQPRPTFNCDETVTDASTGTPRSVTIQTRSAARLKSGAWLWTYEMSDGTLAHADTLTRPAQAEPQE